MDDMARWSPADRADLFTAVANERGDRIAVIVERDSRANRRWSQAACDDSRRKVSSWQWPVSLSCRTGLRCAVRIFTFWDLDERSTGSKLPRGTRAVTTEV
jgi:hypothetical protein